MRTMMGAVHIFSSSSLKTTVYTFVQLYRMFKTLIERLLRVHHFANVPEIVDESRKSEDSQVNLVTLRSIK